MRSATKQTHFIARLRILWCDIDFSSAMHDTTSRGVVYCSRPKLHVSVNSTFRKCRHVSLSRNTARMHTYTHRWHPKQPATKKKPVEDASITVHLLRWWHLEGINTFIVVDTDCDSFDFGYQIQTHFIYLFVQKCVLSISDTVCCVVHNSCAYDSDLRFVGFRIEIYSTFYHDYNGLCWLRFVHKCVP